MPRCEATFLQDFSHLYRGEGAAKQFRFVLACLMSLVFNTQGKTQVVKSSFRVENTKPVPAGWLEEQAPLLSPPGDSETQLLAQATSVIHNSVKPPAGGCFSDLPVVPL